MKSRTSFFNPTVLRKNITRFAPAWAMYSILLLMFMLLLGDWEDHGPQYADNLVSTMAPFAIINFFYALLCAQLVFGDLYNSRMCNALHAMPLKREAWFFSNAVSGILFSLVPNTAVALICLPLVGTLWQVPLLWLAALTLQYLFFFGTAVLSAYCVGNRFAMGLVYIILNGFSIIALWLVGSIYAPCLYGVVLNEKAFFTFSPVVRMVTFEYLNIPYLNAAHYGYQPYLQFLDGWGYLGICTAIGMGCMALALVAYRRRDLETAGDFVAIRWLAPVFLVLYTLCGGACCHGFFELFLGDDSDIFLILGFVIGFFTGLMLLHRTVRVFRKKTLLGFGAFLLAFFLSFILVQVDILGITRWVPKASAVRNVSVYSGGTYNRTSGSEFTDPERIEDILSIHRHGVKNRHEGANGLEDVRTFIRYTLKTGYTVEREYYIDTHTETGQLLKQYLSSPEVVLGQFYTTRDVDTIYLSGADTVITEPQQIQSFLDAIIADCKAGKLPQDNSYLEEYNVMFWIELQCSERPSVTANPYSSIGYTHYASICATDSCENIMAWLTEHNIDPVELWSK